MTDSLPGLDAIDWARLETIDGKATDAPAILRSLASGDAKRSKTSVSWLYREVLHQSTPAPSAERFVPFLVALAALPKQPARWEILALLGELACRGDHRPFLFTGFPTTDDQRSSLHDAVALGIDTFLAALEDRVAKARSASAFVLAWLPEHATRSVPSLRARLAKEKDPTAHASILLALSVLAPGEDAESIAASLASSEISIRAGALVASLRNGPPTAETRALAESLVLAPSVDGLCWHQGQLGSLVLAAVLHAAARDRDATLLASLVFSPVGHVVLAPALERLFPGPMDVATLTASQREFLDRLTRDATLFGRSAGFWKSRGLPASAVAARCALGFERSKTALDEEITVDGVTRRFEDHLVAAAGDASKRKALAAGFAKGHTSSEVFAACIASVALNLQATDADGSSGWQRTVFELLDACGEDLVATLREAKISQEVQRPDGVVVYTSAIALPVLAVLARRDPSAPVERIVHVMGVVATARASDLALHGAMLGDALRAFPLDVRARLLRSIGVDEPFRRAYVATFLDTTPHHELALMYLADVARMRDQYAYGRKQPYLAFAEGFTSAQLKKLAPRDHPLAQAWTAPIASYVPRLLAAGLVEDANALKKALDAFLAM